MNFKWRSYEGYTLGGDGLTLTVRDMAKVGYLLLRKGRWKDKVLLSEQWVDEAKKPQVVTNKKYSDGNLDYGYGWWTANIGRSAAFFAFGLSGQYICVVPQLDLVVVLTWEREMSGDRLDVIRDVVIPSITGN